eukprot:6379191-Pyramimonas_sp.AAC.1
MVSSRVDKKSTALARTLIATARPGYAGDSQFGGTAGRGVDLAGLAMRTYQNIAELQHTSILYLLIDVAQAFYKSVRQLVMRTGQSLEDLALLLRTTRPPPAAMRRFMERLRDREPSLSSARVGPHVRALVALSYRGSWFHVPGSSLQAYSVIGAVPGRQLGD